MALPCGRSRRAPRRRPKPLLMTANFSVPLRSGAVEATAGSRREDEAPGRLHQTGRNDRLEQARNMRPEHAAHRRKIAARQAFIQARDDSRIRTGRCRHRAPAAPPRSRPLATMTARRWLRSYRHSGGRAAPRAAERSARPTFGRTALMAACALPTPPPRCGVTCRIFIRRPPPITSRVPPGASIVGLTGDELLEFLQQRQAVRVDIVGQAVAELAAIAADAVLPPAAFQMLQAQRVHLVGIPDLLHRLCRTSPMISLRPQSRKQEQTSPSAFTE